MALRFSRITTLMEKDIIEITKSKYVLLSIIFMPLLLAILMPVSMITPFTLVPENERQTESLPGLNILPPPIPQWNNLDDFQKSIVVMVYFSHVFFLLVPAILPSVIAADSIAGEKSRKSFEAILATPLKNSEILIAKVGLPFLIGMFGTLIGLIPYSILVYYTTINILGFNILLDINFLLLIFLFAPACSLFTSICMVFVSSRVSNTRDAQQLGSLIILPLIIYLIVQVILAVFSPVALVVGSLILFVIDFILIKFITDIFSRENILTKFS